MTPLTTFKLAEYCQQAGVPDGVVNVVTGYGPTAGEALGRHMDVDKVAFTGSIRTARALLKASGESNLKRLSLELGGEIPQYRLPRCRFGASGEVGILGNLCQQRGGVQRRFAGAGARKDLRRVSRQPRGARETDERWGTRSTLHRRWVHKSARRR